MTTIAPPALRLSNLAGRIDMPTFYERHGCAVSGKPTNSKADGKEYAACCPRCGGADRFSFWESGRFNCVRGCNWHGSSPYFFLRDEGYDHQQALEELGIDQSEIGDSYSQPASKLPLWLVRDDPPNQKWQDAAFAFVHLAEKCLWSSKGESAREYLQSRGLTEATIKAARLGLCPDWYKAPLSDWGLDATQLMKEEDPQIKIPKGITIPWYVEGNVWKIQIRRPEPGPDGKKYKEVLGSSDALYNIDSFQTGQPVLLVESELDALSAQQEASDLVACIATGSTAKGRASRWIGRLKQASQVLQAFDNDENRAGERAADEWLKALANAMRWTPWSHDVNDMLREGQPIRDWIEAGLQIAQVELLPEQGEETLAEFYDDLVEQEATVFLSKSETTPPALDKNGKVIPPELIERVQKWQESPVGCISCGGNDWMVDYDGKLVCPCIEEKRALGRQIDARRNEAARRANTKSYWK